MMLVHAPALVSSVRAMAQVGLESDRLGGLLALVATTIFFGLKIVGVQWLEFATHRRSVVAIILAVVLLHAGSIGAYLDPAWEPTGVPMAATGLLAAGLTSVQRTAGLLLAFGQSVAKRRRPDLTSWGRMWLGLIAPHRNLYVACHCAPRAPPV